MTTTLSYGAGRNLTLDLPGGVLLADCGGSLSASPDEPRKVVGRALAEPLEFPRLRQATVPGDRVTIAVEPGTSQTPAAVAALVDELLSAGVEPSAITVLRHRDDELSQADDPRSELAQDIQAEVTLATHDPTHKDSLAYLAATQAGEPIYLHRSLVDADLVVSLGQARAALANHPHVEPGALYPRFSEHSPVPPGRERTTRKSPRSHRADHDTASEVAWLLGTQFAVDVVSGPGDTLWECWAGERAAVHQRAMVRAGRRWTFEVPDEASLVVATIDGPAAQHTWENAVHALLAAAEVVRAGGELALCCDLALPPGPALAQLADVEDRLVVARALARENLPDVALALALAELLDSHRVYLLSQLDEALVESQGLAFVSDAKEISRLARHHASCIVLRHAQHAVAVRASAGASV